MHSLLVVLLIGLACVLAVILLRLWPGRDRRKPTAAEAAQAIPDLEDEKVGADQMPEDGWAQLTRDLLSRGELRLALRACYLGSLAHLAARNLLSLAKFKSNRDYVRELDRRSHALPEVAEAFAENVLVFDRVWYGLHEVSQELLEHFMSNVERMKGDEVASSS